MKHVMVDLETLGLGLDSVILSIGATTFLHDGRKDTFDARINVASCLMAGLKVDPKTLDWWKGQNAEAQDSVFGEGLTRSLKQALEKFTQYYIGSSATGIWSNGADFDIAMLKHAYNLCGLQPPWKYTQTRCFRTIMSEFGQQGDWVKPVIAHNALEDAKAQAETLETVLVRLGHGV